MKVLFVCEANIMRSQMAEAFYNHLTRSSDAISSGVVANSGHTVPKAISDAMQVKGISMDGMVSKRLTQDMFDAADVVVAFPTPYMPKSVLNDPKALHWDVSDPYYMPDDGTDHVSRARNRIEERIKTELIKE